MRGKPFGSQALNPLLMEFFWSSCSGGKCLSVSWPSSSFLLIVAFSCLEAGGVTIYGVLLKGRGSGVVPLCGWSAMVVFVFSRQRSSSCLVSSWSWSLCTEMVFFTWVVGLRVSCEITRLWQSVENPLNRIVLCLPSEYVGVHVLHEASRLGCFHFRAWNFIPSFVLNL